MKPRIIFNELPLLMVILSIIQICLMLIQVAYSVLVYTETVSVHGVYEGGYETLLVAAVFLVNLFILRQVLRTIKNSYAMIHNQRETIKNIEALNNRIRAQRHDFLNHIQVLYGMVEIGAYDELHTYLHKLYGDIETANNFLKTRVLAVNALLQAKYSNAKSRGIAFTPDISTQLDNAPLSEWDMCRLLGNLIDNALHAAENLDGEKRVQVRLAETLDTFLFSVLNTGKPIVPEYAPRLFEPGFTTRHGKGEGMGLYIVKQITDAHNGTVTTETKDGMTVFTVSIPKTSNGPGNVS